MQKTAIGAFWSHILAKAYIWIIVVMSSHDSIVAIQTSFYTVEAK